MEMITREELEKVSGGALAGGLAGAILGFAAGCISGCAASIYYGDTSGEILAAHMYTWTVCGMAAGAVAPI